MFGMKKISLKRLNSRGMDSAIVKIVFVTVSLVLAAVAIKAAYGGYMASQATVTLGETAMAPDQAISNLTQTIAENV